jgi:tetratricopeptide (TPR) repeat protein
MKAMPGLWRTRAPELTAAAVFIIALIVYLLTLAPTVGPVDSGELILAATLPGIAHPPGFPIYVLIGHVFSRLPFGNVAQRLNLLSAVFAALSAAGLFALIWISGAARDARLGERSPKQATGRKRRGGSRTTRTQARPADLPSSARGRDGEEAASGQALSPRSLALSLLPAGVGALAWAFSRSFWAYATVAEVYTLHLALLVGVLALLLHWRQANRSGRRASQAPLQALPSLYLAAFLYGLSLSNHHITSVLIAPAILMLLVATAGWRVFTSRTTLMAGLCLALGLLPYAYLPIRAAQNPLLNWDNPQDLTRFWWHLIAKWQIGQIQAGVLANPGEFLRLFYENGLRRWVVEFSLLGLPLAGAGAWGLWRRDRSLLAFIAIATAVSAGYGTIYGVTEPAAYFLTTFLFTAWLIGEGARTLLTLAGERLAWQVGAAIIACIVPLLTLGANYRLADRSRDWLVYDYAKNTLAGLAPGGVLLSPDWEVQVSPLLYLHHVEGERPDVLIIDSQLLRRSWYYSYLDAQAPQLMAAIRPQVEAFLAQLALFEHDRPYDPNQIQSRFEAMINALVEQAIAAGRPVYLAQDVDAAINAVAARTQNVVAPHLQRVPQGLSFRLYADQEFHPDPAPELNLRGLLEDTGAQPDLLRAVRRRYAAMFTNRGVYLAQHGQHDAASAAFQQAILVEPEFIVAYQEWGKSLEALGRKAEADALYNQARMLALRQMQGRSPGP